MNITVVIGTSLFLQEHHRRYINITLNWDSHAIKHVEELVSLTTFLLLLCFYTIEHELSSEL